MAVFSERASRRVGAEQHSQAGDYSNRWKFTGHELDRETGLYYANARYYDPKVSIFISVDPLAEKYPNISPYTYVANNPINAIDPDGRLIIFINGLDRGSIGKNYWKQTGSNGVTHHWDSAAMARIGDMHSRYVDGTPSSSSVRGIVATGEIDTKVRYDKGLSQGKLDAICIINSLKKNEKGHITETVKIVGHSAGPAFAKGYGQGLMDYVNEYNQNNKDNPIIGFDIEFIVDIASYYNKSSSRDQGIMQHNSTVFGSTYRMEGDIDNISGHPFDLPGVINIPTKKNTHHFLFNPDGTFNFDPYSLPESRNKPEFRLPYPGEGLESK